MAMIIRVNLVVVSLISLSCLTPDQNLKSSIAAQVLITPSSLVSTDHVVDSHDNDGCGGEFTPSTELSVVRVPPPLEQPRVDQTTVAVNSLNDHIIQMGDDHAPAQSSGQRIVTGSSSTTATSTGDDAIVCDHVPAAQSSGQTMVTGTTSTNSTENGSLNTETPTEGREDEDSFTLGKTLLALCFEAMVALMVCRFQALGNSSPFSSSSASPPPDSSSSLAALSSFPGAMIWATNVFGFTVTSMGMILREAHPTAANICNYSGIFSVALGFYSMMGMLVPSRFAWTVWAAASILLLAFAYSIARR